MKNNYLNLNTISLSLFLISLTLEAFYVGETHIPFTSISLLLSGPFGLLGGYFSWLANPIYIIACLKMDTEPKKSFTYASFAFLLSLTFLLNKNMVMNENGSESPITAYGWGYFLWVLSFAVLALTQYNKTTLNGNPSSKSGARAKSSRVLVLNIIVISLISIPFLLQYYVGETSHFAMEKQRDEFLNTHCPDIKEVFSEKPHELQSIYISQNWGAEYSENSSSFGTLGDSFLNTGMIKFYETDNHQDGTKQLKRYFLDDFKGENIEKTTADYSVITMNLTKNLPKRLDLIGYEILIVDNRTTKTIAKTSYYANHTEAKFCFPYGRKDFSTNRFIISALNLHRNSFPSIYK